ncbi:hypothetical protein [Anaerovorax sp. IOR16]|nr:hypothetical protein [Anaerovorax sp. IOR16]
MDLKEMSIEELDAWIENLKIECSESELETQRKLALSEAISELNNRH